MDVFWVGVVFFIAGAVSVPVVWLLLGVGWWSFSKETGTDGCTYCDHIPVMEIGERFNITRWWYFQMHRWVWSQAPWHRAAVADAAANHVRFKNRSGVEDL